MLKKAHTDYNSERSDQETLTFANIEYNGLAEE